MKKEMLHFFDIKTQKTYTLNNNTLSASHKKSKSIDVICPPLSFFTHIALEIDKSMLEHPKLHSLLFSLAQEKAVLSHPLYAYELYFIPRAHLFDEQKCICESFFYYKKPLLKAHVITNDIFLPSSLAIFGVRKYFVVWIESFLCYFEDNLLKEILPYSSQTSEDALAQIDLHINYLQEAYQQDLEHIYYFMDESLAQNAHLLTKNTQTSMQHLNIAPLSEICEQTRGLSFENFRALLALHYVLLQTKLNLPNFSSKPLINKKTYRICAAMIAVFVIIIPLMLLFYNQNLYKNVLELNMQSENLFALQETTRHSFDEDNFHKLKQREKLLLKNMQEALLWQQSYNQRYAFMHQICKEPIAQIKYEAISFYFTPYTFLALLEINTEKQIHISELLALLNTDTQSAFLQDSIREIQADTIHFIAHIMVIHHAI